MRKALRIIIWSVVFFAFPLAASAQDDSAADLFDHRSDGPKGRERDTLLAGQAVPSRRFRQ